LAIALALHPHTLRRQAGGFLGADAFDTLHHIQPIPKRGFVPFGHDFAGQRWTNTFQAIEFNFCGFVQIHLRPSNACPQDGGDCGCHFFDHLSIPLRGVAATCVQFKPLWSTGWGGARGQPLN
jgi:hypothetical protein